MNVHGNSLRLIRVGIESAEELLPAFNGDEQFLRWSGYPSGTMTLSQVGDDIQEMSAVLGAKHQVQPSGIHSIALGMARPGAGCWLSSAVLRAPTA